MNATTVPTWGVRVKLAAVLAGGMLALAAIDAEASAPDKPPAPAAKGKPDRAAASFTEVSVKISGMFAGRADFVIKPDGAVAFHMPLPADRGGDYKAKFRLRAEHLKELAALLAKTGWLTKPGANTQPGYTDATDIRIGVSRDGATRQVRCHDKNPEPYASLVVFIKRLYRQERLLQQLEHGPKSGRSHACHEIMQELRKKAGARIAVGPIFALDFRRFLPELTASLSQPDNRSPHELTAAAKLTGFLKVASARKDLEALARRIGSTVPQYRRMPAETRVAAIEALMQLGGRKSLETFLALTEDRDRPVRDAVVAALVAVQGAEAIPTLKKMAAKTRSAAWALIRLGDKALPTIVEIIESETRGSGRSPFDRAAVNVIRQYVEHWDELPARIDPRVVAAVRKNILYRARASWSSYLYHGWLLWWASREHHKAGRLEFRIPPMPKSSGRPPSIDREQFARRRGRLAESGPPKRGDLAGYWQWFELPIKAAELAFVGTYAERRYALLSALPPRAMYADIQGPGAWGLKKVSATRDAKGKPAVAFELDENGARLLGELTRTNVGNHLVILVDDKVRSVLKIGGALPGKGTIAGDLTAEEAGRLAAALKRGMPPTKPYAAPPPAAKTPPRRRPPARAKAPAPIPARITHPAPLARAKLAPKQMQRLWEGLAAEDAEKGNQAVAALMRAGDGAVGLLAGRLKPLLGGADAARIQRLIADLDHDKHAARQAASEKLSLLGPLAEQALRDALKGKQSEEARSRIKALLEPPVEPSAISPATRQVARAAWALELIGTAASRGVLRDLRLADRPHPALRIMTAVRVRPMTSKDMGAARDARDAGERLREAYRTSSRSALSRNPETFAQAEAAFRETIRGYPRTDIAGDCRFGLAGLYQFSYDYDRSAREYKEVACGFAGTVREIEAYLGLGLAYLQARHNPAEAIPWFQRALSTTERASIKVAEERTKYRSSAQQGLDRCRKELAARAAADKTPWAKGVDGFQCRLRPDKRIYAAGASPRFRADVQNAGRRAFWASDPGGALEVQVDGKWHGRRRRPPDRMHCFGPGCQHYGSRLVLNQYWYSKADRKPLALKPGKHVVRVAFVALAVGQDPAKPVRTVSDPVEIRIGPPPAKKPAAATPTPRPSQWGRIVAGLQTRLFVYPTQAHVGQPVQVYLDVRNVSDAPIEVAWIGNLGRLLSVKRVTPAGVSSVARKDKRRIERHASSQTLQPGLQMQAWHLRLDLKFETAATGVYHLQWQQIPEGKYVAKGRAPPPSNIAMLRITPPPAAAEPVPWLDGHAWSKSHKGLQTRLTARGRRFAAGKPIPVRLELRNAGKQPRRYYDATGIVNGGVSVAAAAGKGLPFMGDPVSTASGGAVIQPGQTAVLDEFDISDYYYLRKPGRYVLRYEGEAVLEERSSAIPASPLFEIEIVRDPATGADGDPVGSLLAGLPKGWLIWGRANEPWPWTRVHRPGRNFSRVPCRAIRLVHESCRLKAPPGRRGVEPVTVWLATGRAYPEPWQPQGPSGLHNHPTQYLGRNPHYHVYLHVPQSAAKAWPSAVQDVRKMLRLVPADPAKPPTKRQAGSSP